MKDVFVDCIRIGGNTIFDSFAITPDLPQDLAFDFTRNCIGGIYRGNNIGKLEYTIVGTNPFGSISSSIRLYYTRTPFSADDQSFLDTLQKGLRSQFFEVNNTLSNSIRFLPAIPSSQLKIRKMSILHSLNTTSSDLDSSFFAMGILSIKVLYATFEGLLSVTTPGFYTFRFLPECDNDRV